jgi:Domain of unknown function (DUF4760)
MQHGCWSNNNNHQVPRKSPNFFGRILWFLVPEPYFAYRCFFGLPRSSRAIERRKAAAEVIFSTRKDSDLLSSLHKISVIHFSSINIATFAKNDKNGTDDAQSIRYALNHYEYIAVGIDQGIYDEDIFKHSHYSTVLKLYEHTKSYIAERRRIIGRQTTYQEFECLACRWKENPLKHKPIKSIPA